MKTHLLMMRKVFFIGSIFLLFFVADAIGATYYVDPTGSDGNPGTKKSSWRTIQKAADTMLAGDTCIVKDGIYTDTDRDGYVVDVRRNGTASNWITYKAENVGGVIIDGQENGSHSNVFGFFLYFTSHVRLEGFKITNARSGIYVRSSHDIYVYRNEIYNMGREYTYSTCPTNSAGPYSGATGTADSYNVTYDSCKVHDIGRASRASCCPTDYYYDHGLYLIGGNQLVKNCIFYNMYSGWAIKITSHSIAMAGPTHIITNNTFAHDSNDGIVRGCVTVTHGHILLATGQGTNSYHDVIIQNNAFYNPPGNAIVRAGSYTNCSEITLRNNYSSASTLVNKNRSAYGDFIDSNNTLGVSLTNFGMTDPKNNDFSLKASSSYLINSGIATFAVDKDYTGIARPQDGAYDIGAYEYIPQGQLLTAPQDLKLLGPI